MRWGLLASLALVGFGLWYGLGKDQSSTTPDSEPLAAEPRVAQAPEGEASLKAQPADQLGGDPCSGLELLDVEAGGNGSAQGVWLRNREAEPLLVRPGEQFSKFTLKRITPGNLGSQSARLWFGTNPRPCELSIVPGIDLAQALPPSAAEPTPVEPASFPASRAPTREIRENVPMDQIRNPARMVGRFLRKTLGGGKSSGAMSSLPLDAGLP